MTMDFSGIADDFFVNLNLQTILALSNERETVLHFFEAVRKEFPSMTNFYRRESGEFVLEAEHDTGSYRWMEVHAGRLISGYFNPHDVREAYHQHRWLLDRSTYYLGLSGLDVECLDLLMGFNLDFQGNRDAVVAQALLGNSPLSAMFAESGVKPLEFEPGLTVALDDSCSLQARISVETRSSSYQVRTGQYEDEPITIYLTIRQYPRRGQVIKLLESVSRQSEICEDIAARIVVPNVIQPIAATIAAQ